MKYKGLSLVLLEKSERDKKRKVRQNIRELKEIKLHPFPNISDKAMQQLFLLIG